MLTQPWLLDLWNRFPTRLKYFDFGDGSGPVHAHRHSNPDGSPGGWVADSAEVAPTAHVGADAMVFHQAHLLDRGRLEDESVLCGHAVARDDVVISGRSVVGGGVVVKDRARLLNRVRAGGFVEVRSDTVIEGFVKVSGVNVIIDGAHISGYAEIRGESMEQVFLISQKTLLRKVFSGEDGLENFLVIKGENRGSKIEGYSKVVGRAHVLDTTVRDFAEIRDDASVVESEFTNQAKAVDYARSIRSTHLGDSVVGGHVHFEDSKIEHGMKLIGFYRVIDRDIENNDDIKEVAAGSAAEGLAQMRGRREKAEESDAGGRQTELPLGC